MFSFPLLNCVFFVLGNFIWTCNNLGRYGFIMESNKEIYQELLEPLLKELKVGDDISHDLHTLEKTRKKQLPFVTIL